MKSLMRYSIAVACFCALVATGWTQEAGEDTTEAGQERQETQEDERERLREKLRQQADKAREDEETKEDIEAESEEQIEETQEEKKARLKEQLREQLGDLKEKEPQQKTEEPKKEEPGETYFEGRREGQSLARNDSRVVTMGGGAGLLVAYFGYLGYLLVKTDLPFEGMKRIEGESLDYQMGFREGYASERKKRYLKATTVGCLSHYVVIYGLMYLLSSTNWFWYW